MKITTIHARQILDSRGTPTVEADVTLDNGAMGRASVPSGASTGSHEALELRDNNPDEFHGKGVTKAVEHINQILAPALTGMAAWDQREIDRTLQELDGTSDKSRLGANALLAVSLAIAKAQAKGDNIPFYEHIGRIAGITAPTLPMPMMNILNGGKHATGSADIQEFMIIPVGAATFADAVRMGSEVYHSLKSLLKNHDLATTVGDEGGFAPALSANVDALEYLVQAITEAGYTPGRDIGIGMDIAASELRHDDHYLLQLEARALTSRELVEWYATLRTHYPLLSIEDGLSEDEWDGWTELTAQLGTTTQLVGDDLLVTNTDLLTRAIEQKAANAILIKPNQIGTLTETIDAVLMAKKAGWNTIVSHRSGETEDTSIAHIAVGLSADQIKTGSLARTDRTAKYNELLRISEASSIQLAHPL